MTGRMETILWDSPIAEYTAAAMTRLLENFTCRHGQWKEDDSILHHIKSVSY